MAALVCRVHVAVLDLCWMRPREGMSPQVAAIGMSGLRLVTVGDS
ncbi:hypothetical protein ACF08M_19695 [Streptomyces sp. NPDC015032]